MLEREVKFEFPGTDYSDSSPEKGTIESYKKISEENIKESEEIRKNISHSVIPGKVKDKIIKTFRAVLAGGIVGGAAVPLSSCKESPVVEGQIVEAKEEEKAKTVVLSETKEEIKEVQETTPETIEAVETGPVEDEGVTIPSIEGLRYDEESNLFLTEADNPYGLGSGEKAGVFVKDAVEINGSMESFIGLKPEVIELIQRSEDFKYPFFIDLESAKGIKIQEIKNTKLDDAYKSRGVFWDNNNKLEISDIPVGTKIYSPVTTPYFLIWDNNCGLENAAGLTEYSIHWGIYHSNFYKEKLLFKEENFDVADLGFGGIGLNLLPYGTEKNIAETESEGYGFLTKTKIGEPIAEIGKEEYRSIEYTYFIYQLKNKDIKPELYRISVLDVSKLLEIGLTSLLGIEDIPIFINP